MVAARSKERLVQVLRSVNYPDGDTGGRFFMLMVAELIEGVELADFINMMLASAAVSHPSLHIRELSADALYYLQLKQEEVK